MVVIYLLETRHNVASDGADQRCDVIHKTFREAVLPGRLQAIGEVQVVDDALHLRGETQDIVLWCISLKNDVTRPLAWRVSYHELKEEPGLLKSALADAPTAHHPLEGQLLVEELR